MRRSQALLVIALSALSLLAASPSPALAEAKGLQMTTLDNDGGGYARFGGTFNFTNRNNIYIKGTVFDRCPADGHSAYILIHVSFADGFEQREFADGDGCDNGGTPVDLHFAGYDSDPVRSFGISLEERDCHDRKCLTKESVYSGVFTNPYK